MFDAPGQTDYWEPLSAPGPNCGGNMKNMNNTTKQYKQLPMGMLVLDVLQKPLPPGSEKVLCGL